MNFSGIARSIRITEIPGNPAKKRLVIEIVGECTAEDGKALVELFHTRGAIEFHNNGVDEYGMKIVPASTEFTILCP